MSQCCSTHEDISIDVSISTVGLILTKMVISSISAQVKKKKNNTSQNSMSTFFEKKIINFGFPCCSTCEYLSIDVSISTVGLILTKLR